MMVKKIKSGTNLRFNHEKNQRIWHQGHRRICAPLLVRLYVSHFLCHLISFHSLFFYPLCSPSFHPFCFSSSASLPPSLPAALTACLSLARAASVLSSWNNESVPGSCAVTGRSMIPAPTGRDAGEREERERNGRRRKIRIKTPQTVREQGKMERCNAAFLVRCIIV